MTARGREGSRFSQSYVGKNGLKELTIGDAGLIKPPPEFHDHIWEVTRTEIGEGCEKAHKQHVP